MYYPRLTTVIALLSVTMAKHSSQELNDGLLNICKGAHFRSIRSVEGTTRDSWNGSFGHFSRDSPSIQQYIFRNGVFTVATSMTVIFLLSLFPVYWFATSFFPVRFILTAFAWHETFKTEYFNIIYNMICRKMFGRSRKWRLCKENSRRKKLKSKEFKASGCVPLIHGASIFSLFKN